MTTSPTIISGLQRRANTEILNDAGTPFTSIFLMVSVNGVSSGPSCGTLSLVGSPGLS